MRSFMRLPYEWEACLPGQGYINACLPPCHVLTSTPLLFTSSKPLYIPPSSTFSLNLLHPNTFPTMSSHASAGDPAESVTPTILDQIPRDVWTAGGSRAPSDAQNTEADPIKELPTSSSTDHRSQSTTTPWTGPDWSAIPSGGRQAKSFKVDYFAEGVSYSTEIVDGEKRGRLDFIGPSTPGTLTAAVYSDGNPIFSNTSIRAFITLEDKDGQTNTMICLGTDVPKFTFCTNADAKVGYVGWGTSDLPTVWPGADSFRAAHAVLFHPDAPNPAGTVRPNPMYIPLH